MRFENKVAFITGATSGIGRACLTRLKREGAQVFGASRRVDRLEESCEHSAPMDITNLASTQAAVDACVRDLGPIDVLVHAAGIIASGGILDTTPEEWEHMRATNLDGVYNVCKSVVPHMREGGAIVLLSSVCSLRPYPNLLGYCSTKAATDMFTQCLALELAPKQIRVNAINPGVVVTELHTVGGAVKDYAAFLEHSKTTHPLGRVGQAEEIAALAAFLCSGEAGWITGGVHSIDGGRALLSAR